MTDQRDDKEFEAFLTGESELTDRYAELGHEEPPPELDAYILAKARKAAKIHQAEFGPRGGWLKPVALAATLLLSFSLVMKIVVEAPMRYEQVAGSSVSPDPLVDKQSEEKPREAEDKFEMLQQPPVSAVEEITVTARKRMVGTPQSRDDTVIDAPMAVPAMSADTQIANRDVALSIVAEYVDFADDGRAEADDRVLRFEHQAESGEVVTAEKESRSDRDIEEDPESLLREIRRLHADGDVAGAGALLDEFLARYPDHPVSVNIRQQGY